MNGHVAHMGDMINAYEILNGKPEGMKLLGRPKHEWEAEIKMDVKQGGDWIHLAQDRVL
jgi:hypothetical protein